jgi:hypothetical protein
MSVAPITSFMVALGEAIDCAVDRPKQARRKSTNMTRCIRPSRMAIHISD